MRTSVAAYKNPQPSLVPSLDAITTPGRISLKKMTTAIKSQGEVTILDAALPGTRKQVRALLGDVVITGDNLEKDVKLKNPFDWVLFEWTGYQWKPIYRSKS